MYLGKLKKSGTFTRKDVLNGQLLLGQMEILSYLYLAKVVKLDLISIATGYTQKSVLYTYLEPLISQFKLVKRLEFEELPGVKVSTSLFTLTSRGYEKLEVRKRYIGKDVFVISKHRLLIAEILAYFFRHDNERYKGATSNFIDDDGSWKQWLTRTKNRKVEEIRHKYGVGYTTNVAIKQFGEEMRGILIPDLYTLLDPMDYYPGFTKVFDRLTGGLLGTVFIELETGSNHGLERIERKLKGYEEKKPFFENYMDINNFALLFISPDETEKGKLKERIDKVRGKMVISYSVVVMTMKEVADMLPYNKHKRKPK